MEFNAVYDKDRNLTGQIHRRGQPWQPGEYGLVVCVWVYDSMGRLLMTRRAPEKSFPGTWENSGGAAKAGETSIQAIRRELFEETGIRADEEEFFLLDTGRDRNTHYDFYCIKKNIPLKRIVLLPGETDGVRWATFDQVHAMIRRKQICTVIARQFMRQEKLLRRQMELGKTPEKSEEENA